MSTTPEEHAKEFLQQEGIEVDAVQEQAEGAQEETNEVPEAPEEVLEETVNPIEALAAKHGWEKEGKRTAEEYIEFAMEKLPERGKELSKMKAMLEEVTSHMKKQKEVAYQQAVQDLEAQKRDAISMGDHELVDQIEKEKANLDAQETPNAVAAFQEKHANWLNDISSEALEMQDFVYRQDQLLASKNLPPEQHMQILDENLHKKFPDYFGVEVVEKPQRRAAVESGEGSNVAKAAPAKKKHTLNDLSDVQRDMAKFLEMQGTMTSAEYIKQLEELGDLE